MGNGITGIGADHNGRPFGDVDCSEAVDTVDSLRILRHAAGLPPLATPPGCPVVGA